MEVKGAIRDLSSYTAQAADLARGLIRYPSVVPPGEYREIAEYTASFLEGIGAGEVQIVGPSREKANVVARFPGTGGGPTLLLNGHLDVVPVSESEASDWKVDPFAAELIDGTIYGRGAVDMKGQIATMIVAMKALREAGIRTRGDVLLAFTVDEEQGSDWTGAGWLVDNWLTQCDYAIVGEPSDLNIVYYHKGVSWFRFVTKGKSFHAGFPARGVNALEHMVQIIHRMGNTRLSHDVHPVLGSYSQSFDTIRGGTKVNCIADYCEAELDIRNVPSQTTEQILAEIKQVIADLRKEIPTLDAEVSIIKSRVGLTYPENYPLFDMVSQAAQMTKGKKAEYIGAIANSDAQYFRRKGIPTVWMGPGLLTQNAHTSNEHITLEQLAEGVLFFAQSAANICGA